MPKDSTTAQPPAAHLPEIKPGKYADGMPYDQVR